MKSIKKLTIFWGLFSSAFLFGAQSDSDSDPDKFLTTFRNLTDKQLDMRMYNCDEVLAEFELKPGGYIRFSFGTEFPTYYRSTNLAPNVYKEILPGISCVCLYYNKHVKRICQDPDAKPWVGQRPPEAYNK